MATTGQSSGNFQNSSGALRILYSGTKDSVCSLAADGFTQLNPNVVTTQASAVLPTNVKRGVLGGSVAFTRPDAGALKVGGAVLVSSAYVAGTRPLGLFINDAQGNAWENTPGPASGKGPHLRGGTVACKLYETKQQTTVGGGSAGTALTYAVGDRLYASVNGYLTNRWQDSYEAQWINTAASGTGAAGVCTENDVTRLGLVLAGPDAGTAELIAQLHSL